MTNEGVRIFDMKDPANPKEVAVLANDIPGTWQEKVIVQSVSTPSFKGDLAAVSVQRVDKERYGYEGKPLKMVEWCYTMLRILKSRRSLVFGKRHLICLLGRMNIG